MAEARWTDRDIERAFRAGFDAANPSAHPARLETAWMESETRKEIERAKRAEKLSGLARAR